MPLHHDEDVIVHVDNNVTLPNLFYDSKPSKPLTKKNSIKSPLQKALQELVLKKLPSNTK